MTSPPTDGERLVAVVVDASALALALLGDSTPHRLLRQRLAREVCHAPHLIDAEIGNVLRRRVLRRELDALHAKTLLLAATPLIDHRYEMTGGLSEAAWALRENVTFYDALYVALAQALAVPLLTGDRRLTHAPGLPCATELAAYR